MNEPILGKREYRPDNNMPITWTAFLKLRESAQKVADKFGYPVYLVGSALYKDIPRDIDVSVIMPLDKYEEMFGKLPEKQEYYSAYLGRVFHRSFEYVEDLHFCIDYDLDIKVCPDTWWPEKPKLLLAGPRKENSTIPQERYDVVYAAFELACNELKKANIEITDENKAMMEFKVHGSLPGYFLMEAENKLAAAKRFATVYCYTCGYGHTERECPKCGSTLYTGKPNSQTK